MKLIIAVINGDDSSAVINGLTTNGYYSTKLSTSGGFLKSGNVTLMIGVEDEKVDDVISVIGEFSKKRTQLIAPSAGFAMEGIISKPVEITVGGATVFVIDVDRFIKL